LLKRSFAEGNRFKRKREGKEPIQGGQGIRGTTRDHRVDGAGKKEEEENGVRKSVYQAEKRSKKAEGKVKGQGAKGRMP